MKAFDFENNNPIGYVDILPNGNANIDIVGYVDRLNVFHRLNTREAVEFFPPKGRVFAHNFIQKYETYRNRLVCLAVMPNAKDGEGLDSYIWDKSVTVYEYGTRIKTIKANLNEDGENNFCIFLFFVDFFDTLGTLIGVASKADMLDENGKLPGVKPALLADAVATSAGAVIGTSTTTTFV